MNYTEYELTQQIEAYCRDLIRNKMPAANPRAILTGGQPGSGKSSIEKLVATKNDNFIFLNADEFRNSHPHYMEIQKEYGSDHPKHTAQWAGAITEALIERLSKEKYNLIIEGTLRTTAVPERTANILRSNGYQVDLYVMVVKPEISFTGTMSRFFQGLQEGNGRAVDKKHHDLVISRLKDNLIYLADKKCFTEIVLCTRAGKIFHLGNDAAKIIETINHEWSRPMTESEQQDLNQQREFVSKMIDVEKQREIPRISESTITEMRSFLDNAMRHCAPKVQIIKSKDKGMER